MDNLFHSKFIINGSNYSKFPEEYIHKRIIEESFYNILEHAKYKIKTEKNYEPITDTIEFKSTIALLSYDEYLRFKRMEKYLDMLGVIVE
ncbi:MAG TPA: hypothetical protein VK071_05225 [Tissierellales bacterium]|nr:hypothetical protein [Tissierellales bacterium]